MVAPVWDSTVHPETQTTRTKEPPSPFDPLPPGLFPMGCSYRANCTKCTGSKCQGQDLNSGLHVSVFASHLQSEDWGGNNESMCLHFCPLIQW